MALGSRKPNPEKSSSEHPHPDGTRGAIACAVLTISDTRTVVSDRSGQLAQTLLTNAGHIVVAYGIVPDEPAQIAAWIQDVKNVQAPQAIITSGGTGLAPRDTTYDVITQAIQTEIPGFGELFRWLSYQEIGSRALASRAIAGILPAPPHPTLIFALPGSSNAVRLGMTQLILPELDHLITQIHPLPHISPIG